jgi:hypothetical protein
LPISANAPAPAPATVPAGPDELLPIAAPHATPARTSPSRTTRRSARAPKVNFRMLAIAGGVLVALVVVWFGWGALRDAGEDAAEGPAVAIGEANNAVAGTELQTAMQAANVLYLDVGSYLNVNPATLKSVEPSITYVAADQPAVPGEVSVSVVDPQSIVLATSKPDGTCRALYQSPAGTQELVPPGPCSASRVQLGDGAPVQPSDAFPGVGSPGSGLPELPTP